MGYKEDLEINPNALEKEWLDQPRKMFYYAEMLAQAEKARNRAKENLDVVEAGLDKQARTEEIPDLPKTTETAIKNWIIQHPDRAAALDELREADYEVSLLRGAVNAMQARKTALENLVRLFLSKYYSEPYQPGMNEAAEAIDRKDTQEGLGELMKKRKEGATSGKKSKRRPASKKK